MPGGSGRRRTLVGMAALWRPQPVERTTRIISRKDVESVLDMKSALPVVEEAFRRHGRGETIMPPKLYLDIVKHEGDFRAMPGYLHGDEEMAGLKWVNVHPRNSEHGLPTVMGVLIYSDPSTGFPLAVMDATHITRIRTGAAGGVAVKYLARPESRTIGMVGCGAQAESQLLAALESLANVERIVVYDLREAASRAFATRMAAHGLHVDAVDRLEECVSAADVVITTTPSRTPIVKTEWVKRGAHINAIGADAAGKQELEANVLKGAVIVVDEWLQASHSGEINVPFSQGLVTRDDIRATLGEIVAGKGRGRESQDDITVFDSTGLAIQDIATAGYVYKRCMELGLGSETALI